MTRTDPGPDRPRTHRGDPNAAHTRKLLRRELRRLSSTRLSLYVDGPRHSVRLASFDGQRRRYALPPEDVLAVLLELPDGAGPEATLDALAARSSTGRSSEVKIAVTASPA
jgi:hypothetical protein